MGSVISSPEMVIRSSQDRNFDKVEQAFIGVDAGVYIRSDDEDW